MALWQHVVFTIIFFGQHGCVLIYHKSIRHFQTYSYCPKPQTLVCSSCCENYSKLLQPLNWQLVATSTPSVLQWGWLSYQNSLCLKKWPWHITLIAQKQSKSIAWLHVKPTQQNTKHTASSEICARIQNTGRARTWQIKVPGQTVTYLHSFLLQHSFTISIRLPHDTSQSRLSREYYFLYFSMVQSTTLWCRK